MENKFKYYYFTNKRKLRFYSVKVYVTTMHRLIAYNSLRAGQSFSFLQKPIFYYYLKFSAMINYNIKKILLSEIELSKDWISFSL